MKKLLNTIYVTSQGSYLRKEGETVVIESKEQKLLQIPVHMIEGIVCFGNVRCSPFLLGFCGERNISVSFVTESGKFLASVRGPVSGNVLLRRDQYRLADNTDTTIAVAKNIILGKMINTTVILKRAIRDHGEKINKSRIESSISSLERLILSIDDSKSLDELRGKEGQGAQQYFEAFDDLILIQKSHFAFNGRSRRPPLDNVNAVLSYLYTILSHDVRSALESIGLDPSVGFLHRDRPGRYGLALDIMEEFRPIIADRLTLTLINRKQLQKTHFTKSATGAVRMDEHARKTILVAYQQRKQDLIFHPYLKEEVPIGLLFYIQATLLARYIRGDIDGYPPFIWR
jgi:CRISPR-associated protein Cas1